MYQTVSDWMQLCFLKHTGHHGLIFCVYKHICAFSLCAMYFMKQFLEICLTYILSGMFKMCSLVNPKQCILQHPTQKTLLQIAFQDIPSLFEVLLTSETVEMADRVETAAKARPQTLRICLRFGLILFASLFASLHVASATSASPKNSVTG